VDRDHCVKIATRSPKFNRKGSKTDPSADRGNPERDTEKVVVEEWDSKNAIDYLSHEWNNKAAGFVSYGGHGGIHTIEHLRLIMAPCMVATVAAQVALSLFTDFQNFKTFKPAPQRDKELAGMLDQLVPWGTALKNLRLDAAGAGVARE
jgi:hypothetical protein